MKKDNFTKTTPNAESDIYTSYLGNTPAIPQLTESTKDRLPATSFKENIKNSKGDGRIIAIDCPHDFSFEKSRIKAIEHTSLFSSLTMIGQTNKFDIRFKNKTPVGKSKEKLVNVLKSLCIVFTLVGTANVIVVFFSIIFLSISNVAISEFVLYFFFEVCSAVVFIIISIKGSNVENFTLSALNKYSKIVIINLILFFVILICMVLKENPKRSFEKAMSLRAEKNTFDENMEAIVGIVILCLLLSMIYKLIGFILYVILSLLYRRKMMGEAAQELKVLKNPTK